MYGHESQPSVVWKYGSKAPHDGADVVAEQMWRAHRYRNALVEAERDRRDQADAALAELFPEVATATQTVETLEAARNGDRPSEELRAAWKDLRALRKAAFASDDWRARQVEIDTADLARRKELRANSGLYWGTYLHVEQSMARTRSGPPPRFHRWRGDGHLAVQIQGGVGTDEVDETDTRLRIIDAPERSTPRRRRVYVWLRVQSDGRDPVWAVLLVTMHRPLPTGRIKWVHLIRTRVGYTDHWEVQFVVSREGGVIRRPVGDGAVALDLGWRLTPAGLRVGYWYDGAEEGELSIPACELGRWQKSDDLRAIRDKHFDAIRARVAAARDAGHLPEWTWELLRNVGQWRSTGRLARLVWQWGERTADMEREETLRLFAELETWRRKDRHLLEWEAHGRLKAVRWRNDLMRRWVAEFRQRYDTVIVEGANWQRIQRKGEDAARGRQYMRIAAVGQMRTYLEESGLTVLRVPAENTTRTCPVHGIVEEWDAAAELSHTWACGCTWDQDAAAARNLHARGAAVEVQA